jgi:hypothetical protein
MKRIVFVATSLEDLRTFSDAVRREADQQLRNVQTELRNCGDSVCNPPRRQSQHSQKPRLMPLNQHQPPHHGALHAPMTTERNVSDTRRKRWVLMPSIMSDFRAGIACSQSYRAGPDSLSRLHRGSVISCRALVAAH